MKTVKIGHVTYGYSLDCTDLRTVTPNYVTMAMKRRDSFIQILLLALEKLAGV
jgi:hypothetical protein